MGISGRRGDLRKDVEIGDPGRERGDPLEVFYLVGAVRPLLLAGVWLWPLRPSLVGEGLYQSKRANSQLSSVQEQCIGKGCMCVPV